VPPQESPRHKFWLIHKILKSPSKNGGVFFVDFFIYNENMLYTTKLSILVKRSSDLEEINLIFNCLLGALRQNGQIVGKEYPSSFENKTLSYTVLCPEKNSLQQKFHNQYVKKDWAELEEKTSTRLKVTILGEDINAIPTCLNRKRSSYILFTDYVLIESPLRCGECFCAVPLYQISQTDKDEYNDVLTWESNYEACDRLQMNCSAGEKFGLQQISDFKSQLTKQGLKICKKIETLTQKPVFYYLLNYRRITIEQDKIRKCPSCGGNWLLKKKLHRFIDFKCKKCKLVSNLSFNS
jgi:predicted  nucleic acid-binding Zn ribbon protein